MAKDDKTDEQKAAEQKEADDKAAAEKLAAEQKGPKRRKARVLVNLPHSTGVHKIGSVVELTDGEIKAFAGSVDPHPDAVAYAESVQPK